ncbi:hypothetical protein [Dyadobacter sandarakinus]|uniref:PH domain-containing protein n=1 Tax=Dyadobacter sandarakinus TaxID=2747268 RepID=A0ABX7ID39_9BACT|nr:hypothetical protein [Dyadobacter sandarakinus]QRR03033.1 hypothetical protein HWI92_20030 [Dyadobacter sandarakinus]
MTTRETVFLVLFVFAVACGPPFFIAYATYQSNLRTQRILKEPTLFTTSAWRYFVRLDSIIAIIYACMGVIMFWFYITSSFRDTMAQSLSLLVTFLMDFIGYGLLNLLFNHWRHVKETSLFFEPGSRIIRVRRDESESVLSTETIIGVDRFHTRGKVNIYYYQFSLIDDTKVIIPGGTYGVEDIFKYFEKLNYTNHKCWFPKIPK